jgi:hypothetical protein
VVSVVVVAAAAVLILGIPAFLMLRRFRGESWTSLTAAGFMLGAPPTALFWPGRLHGDSSRMNGHGRCVDLYVDGRPTTYARLSYRENAACFGIHGLAGAMAFCAVWRMLARPGSSPRPAAVPPPRPGGADRPAHEARPD